MPFPREAAGYIAATLVNQMSQHAWNQDKALRDWMRGTRLDGFGQLAAEVGRDDAEKMAVLGELRQCMAPAMANAQRLPASGQCAPTPPWPSHFRMPSLFDPLPFGALIKLIVQNWYLGSQYQVEELKYADGTTVTNAQVAGLVSAMASFGAPADMGSDIGGVVTRGRFQEMMLAIP